MTTIDSIKKNLVALRMPQRSRYSMPPFRRIEQGEIDGIEALTTLLVEELTVRENRRVKTALMMARLTAIKTLAGFDFAFQPSLDRNRILALAELKFIDRAESCICSDRQAPEEPSRDGPSPRGRQSRSQRRLLDARRHHLLACQGREGRNAA